MHRASPRAGTEGRDVIHTEEIHSHVWRKLNSRTYTGVISNALSAIDVALWDIRGKKENRSIHELVGGYRNWAPTYATFGYPFFDEKQLAEYGRKFVADGHKMLKMVVGGEPTAWKDDVRRVRARTRGDRARHRPDDRCQLLVQPARRANACPGVEDCNLLWFEEPIQQNDARALADFRRQTSIPVAAGQMEGTGGATENSSSTMRST